MLVFDPSNPPNDVDKFIMLKNNEYLHLLKNDIIYIKIDKEDPGNHSRFIIYNSCGRWITNTTGFRDLVGIDFVNYKAIVREQQINSIFND